MENARSHTAAHADANDRSAVYVELTKPRITAMVMLTVAIGYWLAPQSGGAPSWTLLHALLGAGVACSGAGALNQYIERETDGTMARTRFRPLPTQKIAPLSVLALGAILSVFGVTYLAAMTNALTASLCAATTISYLFLYTPMKRTTNLSTLVGAVPGALPPVMGWTAREGAIGEGAWLLFAILFLWQIPHFLAIGRLYRDDYAEGGFPMLVVIDGDGAATGRQMVLYAAALIPCSLASSLIGLTGALYFWVALAAGAAYLGFSIAAALDPGRRTSRNLLLCSVVYLPVLFGAMLIDGLL